MRARNMFQMKVQDKTSEKLDKMEIYLQKNLR